MMTIMSPSLAALFDASPTRLLAPGEVLFRTGDPVQVVALVRSGRVDLVRHTGAGGALVFQRAGPGAVVAEASVYADAYHCDAVAAEAALVATLRRGRFRTALDRDAALSGAWAAHLAHTVQAARWRAEIRTLRTVRERLDAWIEGGGAVPPRGAWQTLAAELGVTREALYRAMAQRR